MGWPLTDEVNAFTLSLVIYPVIVTGLLLYRADRVGPGFWALVSGGGAIFVSAVRSFLARSCFVLLGAIG